MLRLSLLRPSELRPDHHGTLATPGFEHVTSVPAHGLARQPIPCSLPDRSDQGIFHRLEKRKNTPQSHQTIKHKFTTFLTTSLHIRNKVPPSPARSIIVMATTTTTTRNPAGDVPGNVLIVGATGVIGRYITSAVISSGAATRVTIFTSPATAAAEPGTPKHKLLSEWKATPFPNHNNSSGQGNNGGDDESYVRVITGDINSETDIRAALRGQNTIISALGRGSLLAQIPLLRLAEENASLSSSDGTVRWFLPSEYGTDIEYDAVTSPHEKPHQNKLAVRKFVREQVRNLKVTYVVTGPYLDMFLALSGVKEAQANGGFDVKEKKAVLVGDGQGKVGFTSMPE